jgi:type IV pilus modification protein PilV
MNRTERTIQPTPRNPQIKGTATHTGGRSWGFTLIELMVTLTVAVILIAIAIPSFNYLTVSSKLTTVSNGLVTALNTARLEAIKRNNLVTVCSDTGNGTDTLGTACGTQAGAVYATLPDGTATLVRAGIVGLTPPISIQNLTRLNFSGQGLGEAVGSHAEEQNLMRPANKYASLPTQSMSQAGVGLIEVLIAVLVLSIGFLGMAALQAKSLSTNNSAMSRSMATIASYSILDAMRADRANALAGAYDGTVTANACPTTTGTLAQTQLGDWCSQLAQNLGPLATTTGKVKCSGTGDCTITIQFDDSRAGAGGSNAQQVITKAML